MAAFAKPGEAPAPKPKKRDLDTYYRGSINAADQPVKPDNERSPSSGATRRRTEPAEPTPRTGLARVQATDQHGLYALHRKLLEAYVGEADFNLLKACDIAGLAVNDPRHKRLKKAERIMARPEVRAFMQQWIESDPLVMSRQERLRILTGIARGTATETRYGRDGESFDATPTLDQRMKALDLLGKAQGDAINVNVTINPDQMSEAEIIAALVALGDDPAKLGDGTIDTDGEDMTGRDEPEDSTLPFDAQEVEPLSDVDTDP